MDKKNILKNMKEYYTSIESTEKINYIKSKKVLGDLSNAHCLAVATMQKIVTSHILEPGRTSKRFRKD